MALLLSFLAEDRFTSRPSKISLAEPPHVKIYRIWMFAMLKDRPTQVERDHIDRCESCGKAFKAALGISSFGKESKDPQSPPASNPPARSTTDEPKAVA